MYAVFNTPSFWYSLSSSLIFVFFFTFVVGRSWIGYNGSFKSDSFFNPINTAITVAGFILPLVVALLAWAFSVLKQENSQLSFLLSAIILLSMSIAIGLWISFSLATQADKEGYIKIDKDKNTFFPAFMVAQLMLLYSSVIVLFFYCLLGLQRSPT